MQNVHGHEQGYLPFVTVLDTGLLSLFIPEDQMPGGWKLKWTTELIRDKNRQINELKNQLIGALVDLSDSQSIEQFIQESAWIDYTIARTIRLFVKEYNVWLKNKLI